MRMLLPHSARTPALVIGTLCLAAACLTGCSFKNPFVAEPAIAAAKPAEGAAKTAEGTAAAPATGVQTTKKQRFFGFLSPYRVDIQQGNFVSQEMVAQLKVGMTPDQVRFLLGTPLLTDVFHANRWDYAFRLQKGDGEVTTSRVSVFFKENRVAYFEGGDLPTEKDYLARIAGTAPAAK